MMNKNGFSRCAEFYIGRLRKEGRHSTAHVYKNAIFSFSKFCGTSNVSFRQYGSKTVFPEIRAVRTADKAAAYAVFTVGGGTDERKNNGSRYAGRY